MSEERETTEEMTGRIGYLIDGEMVHILQDIGDDDALICRIYTDYLGEEALGQPEYAPQVFDHPPTPKLDQETQIALDRLNEIYAEINEAAGKRDAINRDLASIAKRCEAIDAIKNVLDYCEGKITHYVISSHGDVRILTLEETFRDGNGWASNGSRLLTLTANKTGRGVSWQLNQYRDGSGNDTTCSPCRSLEEAQTVARNHWMEIATGEDVSGYTLDKLIKCADSIGIDIPRALLVRRAKERAEQAERNVAKYSTELATYTALRHDALRELNALVAEATE